MIWHNAENTLFTLEVFPSTAGLDPGDVKPLVEKPISYCIVHSFMVNHSCVYYLRKAKKIKLFTAASKDLECT